MSTKTKVSGLILAVLTLTTGIAGTPFADETAPAEVFESHSLVGGYLAGRMAQGVRDSKAATAFLGQVLDQDPNNEVVLNNAFLNAVSLGNFDTADKLASKLLVSQPNNRIALLVLGTKAFRERNWAEADKRFKESSASPIGEVTATLARAWVSVARGDAKAATTLVDKLTQADWTKFYRLYNLALVADVSGDRAAALKSYSELFDKEPRTVAVAMAYAGFLARGGEAEKARGVLRANLKAARAPHPMPLTALDGLRRGEAVPNLVSTPVQGLSQVFYGLGEALANEGGVDLGAIYVQLALRLDPTSPLALASLAAVQEQGKQYEHAIETYQRLPEQSPLAVSFAIRRSLNLSALDRPDEAKTVLGKLLERPLADIDIEDPPIDRAFVDQARALQPLAAGAKGPAVESMQKLLAIGGFATGKPDGIYGKTTQDAVRRLQAGAKQTETGVFDAAASQSLTAKLEKMASGAVKPPRRDTEIDVISSIANIQRGRKEWADANQWYTKAIELAGTPTAEHWELFYSRGICNERTKQWDKAEADFLQALKLRPDEASVLNYLGYSWVDQGRRMDEALDMIKQAVKLKPDDGYIVDSLGWAYYKLGRYDEAAAQLERAVELRPDDPVLNDHLGDAFWRSGRRLEAKFQWSWSLSMKPEPEDIPRIKAKLAEGLKDETPAQAATAAPPKAQEPMKDTTVTEAPKNAAPAKTEPAKTDPAKSEPPKTP